jgi:hypothetical protein
MSPRATGSNGTSTSASATTTNASVLIFDANIVFTPANQPGSNFTQRLLTSPDGDIAEDEMVTVTGSYGAMTPLSASGPWIMQMVAFRAASGPPPALAITPYVTVLTFAENRTVRDHRWHRSCHLVGRRRGGGSAGRERSRRQGCTPPE